jgi:urate oxidase
MSGSIRLGANQYGKAEVRVVTVARGTPRHEISDLNVTSLLRGDFAATHLSGDNALVVATDSQKNVVYTLAREHGIGAPEAFLLRLAEHFTSTYPQVTGGRWEAEAYAWERIAVGGEPHDHAFVRAGGGTRTAVVTADGDARHVLAGLTDLVVLKSTGSEFHGFVRDRWTTLPETDDRILATAVTARWRYASTQVDFDAAFASVRALLLERFAATHSLALQQTLHAMGEAVLRVHPEVAEIRFSMPNRHHVLVDLEPFGLDNPGEVFVATDRPYGLIEAVVEREGAPPAGTAWEGTPGFV